MKDKPEFLITYKCKTCGELSHFAETQEAECRYCENSAGLEVVEKQKLTPELMEKQLKESMERTFKNLQAAFESMTEEDKAAFGETDAEKEMLLLLARTKNLKEHIDKLDFKKSKEDPDAKSGA